MISALNRLVDLVEEHLTEELDVDGLAMALGTTEYHLRRMFSSLAATPWYWPSASGDIRPSDRPHRAET